MIARAFLWLVCPLAIAFSLYCAAFYLWLSATPDRAAAALLFYRWLAISLLLALAWLVGIFKVRRAKRHQ